MSLIYFYISYSISSSFLIYLVKSIKFFRKKKPNLIDISSRIDLLARYLILKQLFNIYIFYTIEVKKQKIKAIIFYIYLNRKLLSFISILYSLALYIAIYTKAQPIIYSLLFLIKAINYTYYYNIKTINYNSILTTYS